MITRSFLVVLICLILASSMLLAPTLRNSNRQSSDFVKGSETAPTSCSTNCPAQRPPVMIGWGGLWFGSATTTCFTFFYPNPTHAARSGFPRPNQTNHEKHGNPRNVMQLN